MAAEVVVSVDLRRRRRAPPGHSRGRARRGSSCRVRRAARRARRAASGGRRSARAPGRRSPLEVKYSPASVCCPNDVRCFMPPPIAACARPSLGNRTSVGLDDILSSTQREHPEPKKRPMPTPSPFHERTAPLCRSYAWKDWAGYCAVARYDTSHEREYFAFRETAGLLDVSPLFKYEVTGPDATTLLARMMTRDISSLKVGRVAYSCWCDDAGRVVDDGTVARLDEEHYRVTAADPSLHWLEDCGRGMNVRLEDSSRRLAALALQGPTSRDDPAGACARFDSGPDMDGLKFFGVTEGVDRRRPGLDQPHRLHRRSGLRDLDGERPGARRLGRAHRRRDSRSASSPRGSTRSTSRASRPASSSSASTTTARPRSSSRPASRRRSSSASAGWSTAPQPGRTRQLHRPRRHPRRAGARPGLAPRRTRSELGGARGALRELQPAAFAPRHGAPRRPAGLRRGRPPDRQGDHPHLVADPQEVSRHRLGASRLRGQGHAAPARAHRRVRAPQGRGHRRRRHRSTIPKGSASREPAGSQIVRRHRRRRGTQRPDLRRLSRQGRAQGPGPRAPPPGRRRHDDRRDLPRLQVHLLLLRRLAAPAVDHPRSRPAALRLRDPAARLDLHAVPRRPLSDARRRSGEEPPRHRRLLAARRRGLQALRAGDGRARPAGEAGDRRRRARSDVAESARSS